MAKLYEFELAITVRAEDKEGAEALAKDAINVLNQRTDIITEDSCYVVSGPDKVDKVDEEDDNEEDDDSEDDDEG